MLTPFGKNIFSSSIAALYRLVIAVRNWWYDHNQSAAKKVNAPVISIGGVHAGGSGKTPMALLTARYFATRGYSTVFVSRGYGRLSGQQCYVRPDQCADWQTCGDEPTMLHERLPHSWLAIGANRYKAISQVLPAINRKPFFILDDGFQHRKIKRTIDIVCLPSAPFNAHLMPVGYLREPLENCARADIICVIGLEEESSLLAASRERLQKMWPSKPVFSLVQKPAGWINALTGEDLAAPPLRDPMLVCGIARPERFITIVKRRGIICSEIKTFNDHHIFTVNDINYIKNRSNGRGIITTHKDAVRLREALATDCNNVWYLSINLFFTDDSQEKQYFSIIEAALT